MNNEAFHAIADQVGIAPDKQWFIDEPEKYFNDNSEQFMERFIDEYDEDTTVWIGLVDEAILADKAWEFDCNTELGDFVWGLEKILPEDLSVSEELFDENEYIGVWSAVLNKEWSNEGYTLAGLDIDSDCYVIIVCKKDVFEQLQAEAAKVGHKIDLPENM